MLATSSSSLRHEPPWFEEADDEIDDDWFYDSIKRYDQLCMYNLSCSVQSLDVSPDGSSVCLSGVVKSRRKQKEVLLFSLPQKLLADCPMKEGLLNKRDFSLLAGGAWEEEEEERGDVKQVSFFNPTRVLLLTGNKLSMWWHKESTDLMLQVKFHEFGETVDRFRIVSDECVIVFGSSKVWRLDAESLSVTAEIDIAKVQDIAMIKTTLASAETALVFAHSDGRITVTDFNTLEVRKTVMAIEKIGDDDVLLGAVSRGSNCRFAAFCNKTKGCLSAVKVLEGEEEERKEDERVAKVEDELLTSCSILSWTEDDDLFAVCGEKVCIFAYDDISKTLRRKFCHDGHRSPVTDCAGHQSVPRLFFSADVAGSLHAWLFAKENTSS